jgi:hypothetical protein
VQQLGRLGPRARAAAARPSRALARDGVQVALLVAVVGAVPLAVALAALRQPRWYPVMDLALTELRIRDVGSAHTPLVGLVGRLYGWGRRGSHPGPLSFWLLWPLYNLFGRSAWAMEAAAAALNLAAMAVAVWIGQRRGGRVGALGVAVMLVVLAHTYGPETLTQPWNPYIPLLWWVVFLLAAWSVLCDDLVLLPVAAFAGTLCVQTHVPYLGLVGGIGGVLVVALGVWARRWWSGPGPQAAKRRRRLVRWAAPSLALAALLWLPPALEQLTHHPGNVAILRASLSDPHEEAIGASSTAVRIWLAYLDVGGLVHARDLGAIAARRGNPVPGLALLAVWAWSVARARRDNHGPLLRLHLVVGAALALGLVSIARIQGGLASWVVLWAWGTTAVLLLAVAAVAHEAWQDRRPGAARLRWPGRPAVATGVLVALVAVGAAGLTYQAAGTEPDSPDESAVVAALAPDTVERLRAGRIPGTGDDGRYLLRWSSLSGFRDAAPYGLLLELERDGLDVGTPKRRSRVEVPYRWRDAEDATAFVDYAVGPTEIARHRADPKAIEIAHTPGAAREPAAIFVTPARGAR